MRKWVSYILVIFICLQSVLAVADSHAEHYLDTDLKELCLNIIDTKNDHNIIEQLNDDQYHEHSIDCHHNHCPHFYSITTSKFSYYTTKSKVHLVGLNDIKPNSITSLLYRPPKA